MSQQVALFSGRPVKDKATWLLEMEREMISAISLLTRFERIGQALGRSPARDLRFTAMPAKARRNEATPFDEVSGSALLGERVIATRCVARP